MIPIPISEVTGSIPEEGPAWRSRRVSSAGSAIVRPRGVEGTSQCTSSASSQSASSNPVKPGGSDSTDRKNAIHPAREAGQLR
eukprot:7773583-Pyramimonas_sp.AAC.1